MSDSPPEENRTQAPTGRQKHDSGYNSKAGIPLVIYLLCILALLGLAVFGWTLGSHMFASPKPAEQSTKYSDETPKTNGDEQQTQDNLPMSLLPDEPEGVTVLTKQPEPVESSDVLTAPISGGADIATGFAMDLGAAKSFLELSERFSKIVELNGADNFQRLEPRAILQETVAGLEARLLVGPFETENAAKEACEVLLLAEEIACMTANFAGELIARQ